MCIYREVDPLLYAHTLSQHASTCISNPISQNFIERRQWHPSPLVLSLIKVPCIAVRPCKAQQVRQLLSKMPKSLESPVLLAWVVYCKCSNGSDFSTPCSHANSYGYNQGVFSGVLTMTSFGNREFPLLLVSDGFFGDRDG